MTKLDEIMIKVEKRVKVMETPLYKTLNQGKNNENNNLSYYTNVIDAYNNWGKSKKNNAITNSFFERTASDLLKNS